MTTVYVPRDSAARSVGADDVADALVRETGSSGLDVTVVRNGSRGMLWCEPLIEVVTDRGRVGYGPSSSADVAGLLEAGMLTGTDHETCVGVVDDHPWLTSQQRVTFARVGVIDPLDVADFEAHGGLSGLR
ncbi:MAG: formate dehydrogenase, partial [Actinomycetes bacterium]